MSSRILHSSYPIHLIILFTALLLNISSLGNETDRLSLLAFKSNILQDPYGVMSLWNDSLHCCQWQGVKCGQRHRRVTVLDLGSRSLGGSLSPSIGNLSFLREINLQNNSLQGEIPPHVGRLFRLESLKLYNNSLEGRIPSNLSRCSNLMQLILAQNKLEGEIPGELGTLFKLQILAVSENNLRGEIPSSIGNLTFLRMLYASTNELEGSIPDVLGALRNLEGLAIGANKLHGTVPSSIFNLSSLAVLSLASNQLHGSLPPDFGRGLPRMTRLQIWGNQFTGPIPLSLSNASQLTEIYFSYNNFTGKVPNNIGILQYLKVFALDYNSLGSEKADDLDFFNSIANCSTLEDFAVNNNRLGGFLAKSVGNLSTQLQYFGVATNRISGVIPSEIGNLVNLEILVMGGNRFEGQIPDSFGKMKKLQALDLSINNLTGPIPSSLGNLSFFSKLYLDNNRLEGNIPSVLGNCQYLLTLNLTQNNLNGTIPKELFNASAAISLSVAWNHLIGPIPPEVGNLKYLVELDVSENQLSGEIPSAIGSCLALVNLYVGANDLEGSIPPPWATLKGIENLNLSRNKLSGSVPVFLENFPLKNLDLSFNNFEGELPTEGVFRNGSAISVLGNGRLCGGVSELRLPSCKITPSKRRKLLKVQIISIIIACTLFSVTVLFSFIVCWFKKRTSAPTSGSLLTEGTLRVSYENLLKATDGFSAMNLIGMGSFGSVYKGVLHQLETQVAVKVLNLQHRGASKSFMAECEALKNIRHRNLVKVITSCSSIDFQGKDFKALVYEFMPNGSLERWLHSSQETADRQDEPRSLSLRQRIQIAIDVACALDYLHHQCGKCIIHCDLKPSNILLDSNMVAHVGDFGLARFLLPQISNNSQNTSSGIKGTIGYVAPEYGLGSEVSTNGDVYSYGIMLLEMITGKSPTDSPFQGSLNLHNFARMALPDRVTEIVEPTLLMNKEEDVPVPEAANEQGSTQKVKNNDRREDCLAAIIKIGIACSLESPQDRMDINSVIHELHAASNML